VNKDSELAQWIRTEGLSHEPSRAQYQAADELDLFADAIGSLARRIGSTIRSRTTPRR